MPLTVITEEEKKAGLAALDAELRFLLEEKKIVSDMICLFGHLGLTDVATLAHIEETEAKFREMLEKEFGMVSSEGMAARVQTSRLIDIWHAARERNAARNAEATAARIEGRQRELPAQTFVSVRRQFQELNGKYDDENFPSKEYIQNKIEQLEEGEIKTESLTEVVSVKEAGEECAEDSIMFDVGSRKGVKATKAKIRVRPPTTTEELRMRIQLMKVQFEIVRNKHPDRLVFAKYDPMAWDRFLSYLLGSKVAGYSAHSGTTLRWEDLLAYEYALRKFATEYVNDGTGGFTEGLMIALKDGDLKSTYFTLPLTVSGKRGSASGKSSAEELAQKIVRHEFNQLKSLITKLGANKSKSDGKAQRKENPSSSGGDFNRREATDESANASALTELKKKESLRFRTEGPNGKMICQFFQRNACTRGNCKFVHICWRCHKPGHGIVDCPAPPKLR